MHKAGQPMQPVGLIGGMSWESTAVYYRQLNLGAARRLGKMHSFPLVIHSMDFDHFERLSHVRDWATITDLLTAMGRDLKAAGVGSLVLCSNTAHIAADAVQAAVGLPLISIIETTAQAIEREGLEKVALLGTAFTMEEGFYQTQLSRWTGAEVLIPDKEDRQVIHQVIYEELVQGVINPTSRISYQSVISKLARKGAQGVILGCTEIGLLISQQDTPLSVLDSTALHCEAIVDFLIPENPA
ncbi:MAG: amino acid racemase [Gammaproteobacteria bacterium]|nr:amino acid racemase [Gammaproteobacteria bacterium]